MQLNIPIAAYGNLLGTYLRPQRGRVALLALSLLGAIGLTLANPQVIRSFIDSTQQRNPNENLIWAGAAFIALGLSGRLLWLATVYLGINIGWSATNALRSDLTAHLLRLDMPFHKTHTPGELIERVDGDVTALANFFSQFAIRILGNTVLIIGALMLLYAEDWRAGLGLTFYVLIILGALLALQNLGVRRWEAARQASAEQFSYIEERVSGTEDIRGSGAEAYTLGRLYPLMRRFLHTNRSAEMVGTFSYGITYFLFISGYALGLGLGAYLYSQGEITIGTAFLIVLYIGMVSDPLERIRQQVEDLQKATASIGRVRELFNRKPQVVGTGTATLPGGPLAVEFKGVSFAYNDEPGKEESEAALVLRDVSFALQPGRVLGVLGRTGSGKTTLTRLLFRLYDPTKGAVRLGDSDTADVTLDDLRSRVGMVTQDVQLFRASLRDNIAFFDSTVGAERIDEALTTLGLRDWVAAMPQGLETELATAGAGMSAGEAQLLAFTRVLLRDPSLVILDEAASRLDPITERRLERAIDRLLVDRTAIIIAHRLRTVDRADDILILDGGRVVEYGPRERLVADPNSRFYRLLQTGLEEALV